MNHFDFKSPTNWSKSIRFRHVSLSPNFLKAHFFATKGTKTWVVHDIYLIVFIRIDISYKNSKFFKYRVSATSRHGDSPDVKIRSKAHGLILSPLDDDTD